MFGELGKGYLDSFRAQLEVVVKNALDQVAGTGFEQFRKTKSFRRMELLLKATFALSLLSFGLSVVILIVVLVKR